MKLLLTLCLLNIVPTYAQDGFSDNFQCSYEPNEAEKQDIVVEEKN